MEPVRLRCTAFQRALFRVPLTLQPIGGIWPEADIAQAEFARRVRAVRDEDKAASGFPPACADVPCSWLLLNSVMRTKGHVIARCTVYWWWNGRDQSWYGIEKALLTLAFGQGKRALGCAGRLVAPPPIFLSARMTE